MFEDDESKFLHLIGWGGVAFMIFWTFVIQNFQVSDKIYTEMISGGTGFSSFFSNSQGDMSVPFIISLVLGIVAGVIVAAIGFFGGEESYIGIGIGIATLGTLIVRLAIALLGYIIWLLFSVFFMGIVILVGIGFMIYFLKETFAKLSGTICLVLCSSILILLFVISIFFYSGTTMEYIIVALVRVSI